MNETMSDPDSVPSHTQFELDEIRWHDLECGVYEEDFEFWRTLAHSVSNTRILDLGCGTGRVALDLAARGHRVVAADIERVFCEETLRRAKRKGLTIEVAVADATDLQLDPSFGAIILPMQTLHLLGGAGGRDLFYEGARRILQPSGTLALTIVEEVEAFGPEEAAVIAPDMREYDGCVYSSHPCRITVEGDVIGLERNREIVEVDGTRRSEHHRIELDALSCSQIEAELVEHGFKICSVDALKETDEHVESTVVIASV